MHRVVLALIAVAGVLVAGIGVWCSTTRQTATFGWTAYSPLSSGTYPITTGPPWWALALIAVGCLTIGAALALLVVSAARAPGTRS